MDHTFNLALDDSLEEVYEVGLAVKKAHDFVTFMKDSSLAREKFFSVQVELGLKPLTIMLGTDNRCVEFLFNLTFGKISKMFAIVDMVVICNYLDVTLIAEDKTVTLSILGGSTSTTRLREF